MQRRLPLTHKPHGLQQAENPLDPRSSFQLLRTGGGVERAARVTTFNPLMATVHRYVILIDDRSYLKQSIASSYFLRNKRYRLYLPPEGQILYSYPFAFQKWACLDAIY